MAAKHAAAEVPSPTPIGPYRILELIGEGGMGVVYAAEQSEPVSRRVALKVIKLGMDSQAVISRFHLEQQALAMMSHDAIARVFDAGTTDRGQPFFVMELVEGTSLTDYCDSHELSLPERIGLFRQVCAGVQHAHQKGVIHRDLKPGNVLVARKGGDHVAKIIDFGVARAMDQQAFKQSVFTERGEIVGTPLYMSPEQAAGDRKQIDTRTDVYSLGVMLYELLIGVLPFPAEELRREGGLLRILHWLQTKEPPKPSTRLAQQGEQAMESARQRQTTSGALGRELRRDLDWIVLKAMAKEPERRYGSPAELASDLDRYLRHEPVLAGPPTVRYRLRKLVRRYRAQVVAGLLVALTFVAGAVGTLWFAIESADNAHIARRNEENAKASAQLANDRATRMAQLAEEKGKALSDFRLLANVVQLADAKAIEATLYPAYPDKTPAMRAWLRQYGDPLAARLPSLERALVKLGRKANSTSAEGGDRFLHQTLTRLVHDLRAFSGERGEVAAVRQRLAAAQTVVATSIDAYRQRWDEALAAIAKSDGVVASTLYDHYALKPQIGLVPLGMDPESKLWEFVHLASGTPGKEFPARDEQTHRLRPNGDMGVVLVLLPAGTFVMGARRGTKIAPNVDPNADEKEAPPHEVALAPFFLSKYELTQGQWMRMSGGENPSRYREGYKLAGRLVTLTNPVEQVDWQTCDRLLARHGLVLPTEAQWEYGCRAGTTTRWFTGNEPKTLAGYANVLDETCARSQSQWGRPEPFDDGYVVHAPVGSFLPNAFGLCDMHGNVWEWCRDWWSRYSVEGRAGDGLRLVEAGVSTMRVDRGGAYGYPASSARCSNRGTNYPGVCANDLGCRPARVAD